MWTADVNDLNIFAFDLHRPSYQPFGMTLVDYNSTRQNLSEQRRGNLALRTIQLLPRSSPVSL